MIEELIDELIEREGGYVNHPQDSGGPTNMGITLFTLHGWRPSASLEDLKNLTKLEASDIYMDLYWEDLGFDKMTVDPVVIEMLFDAAVHHGPTKSVKLLQRAVGVKRDGRLGPITRGAIHDMEPVRLAAALIGVRVAYIGRIITKDPSQAVFAAGWANRMQEFILKVAEV